MNRLFLTMLLCLLPATVTAQPAGSMASVAPCDGPQVLDLVQRIARDMITQHQGPQVAGEVVLSLADIQTLATAADGLSRRCRGVLAVQRRAGSTPATQYLNYTIENQIGGRTFIRFADTVFVPPQ